MKTTIKPSKPASAGMLIVTCFMLICGIAFFVLIADALNENEAPPGMSIFFFLFMIAWIVTALVMLISHAVNLKRAKGLPMLDIETEGGPLQDGAGDPMQRLRSLEALKQDGLISEQEYEIKRAEIMKEKW